jgi:hypothetical protein
MRASEFGALSVMNATPSLPRLKSSRKSLSALLAKSLGWQLNHTHDLIGREIYLEELRRSWNEWFSKLKRSCVEHPKVVGLVQLKCLNRKQSIGWTPHICPIQLSCWVGNWAVVS